MEPLEENEKISMNEDEGSEKIEQMTNKNVNVYHHDSWQYNCLFIKWMFYNRKFKRFGVGEYSPFSYAFTKDLNENKDILREIKNYIYNAITDLYRDTEDLYNKMLNSETIILNDYNREVSQEKKAYEEALFSKAIDIDSHLRDKYSEYIDRENEWKSQTEYMYKMLATAGERKRPFLRSAFDSVRKFYDKVKIDPSKHKSRRTTVGRKMDALGRAVPSGGRKKTKRKPQPRKQKSRKQKPRKTKRKLRKQKSRKQKSRKQNDQKHKNQKKNKT